jgi:hypothetical protein
MVVHLTPALDSIAVAASTVVGSEAVAILVAAARAVTGVAQIATEAVESEPQKRHMRLIKRNLLMCLMCLFVA